MATVHSNVSARLPRLPAKRLRGCLALLREAGLAHPRFGPANGLCDRATDDFQEFAAGLIHTEPLAEIGFDRLPRDEPVRAGRQAVQP